MDEKVLKKTQESLGKIITKPPLTSKLLNKPPFRFLHDIITEVIRTTSFMKGLYQTEEMDSKQVSTKDAKVAFLQKAISCVGMVHGSALTVRPTKIIAGHEPEKTNEFLQVMARCIRKNKSSEEAVQKVLSGDTIQPSKSKSAESQKREGEEGDRKKERSSRHHRDKDAADEKRKHRSKEGEGGDKDDKEKRRRERSEKRDKSAADGKDKERSSRSRDDREKSKHRSDKSSRRHRSGGDEKTKKDEEEGNTRDKSKSRDKDDEKREQRRQERRKQRHEQKEKAAAAEETAAPSTETKPEEQTDEAAVAAAGDEDAASATGTTVRAQRPASAKGQRRRPQSRSNGRNHEANETAPVDQQPTEQTPPPPPMVAPRKLVRPPSARPSAPRVRRNVPLPADEEMEVSAQDKNASIIVDGDDQNAMTQSDEEDAQFMVQEDKTLEPLDAEPLPVPGEASLNGGDELNGKEHGGLVRKILQTKKELEGSASQQKLAKTEILQQRNVVTAQQLKEQQLVVQEIEQLRESVQKLCQSSAPLAKLIDYSQEDRDAMQNELQMWRKENREHAVKIKEDNKVTAMSIEPLKAELEELEQSISVYRTQMAATKANIIRNEEKIHKMMIAVATRS